MIKKLLLLFILVVWLFSCKKDDENNCGYDALGEGRAVFCSDTVAVGDTIFVTLVWENTIPCQNEFGFMEIINGNERTIALRTRIDACNCDNSDSGVTYRTYKFIAPTVGIQIIKTYKKANFYEIDTVVVL